MKSRVLWGLLILAIIIAFYAAYSILPFHESSKTKSKEKTMHQTSELFFGKWNGSIAFLRENDEKTLNLIFIEQSNEGDFSELDNLTGVLLNQTENIEVVRYNIIKGDKIGNNQRLMNLVVHIKTKTNQGIDKFSNVSLLYKDSEPEIYNIGEINVIMNQEQNKEDIIVEDSYNLSYPKNIFNGAFKNNTQEELRLVNFTCLNAGITYNNITINGVPLDTSDGIVIQPNEIFSIEAKLEVNSKTGHQFLQVTPVIQYMKDSKIYEQLLMETTYGLLKIDDKIVKEIINNEN